MFFFPRTVKWVRMKTKEINGWKMKNVTRRFLVQIHPSRFVSRSAIFSLKIKKNVAVDEKSSFIFCTQCGAQNAGNDFKIFCWSMLPDPPSLRSLMALCSYSQLFFSNQLPTSKFIETLDLQKEITIGENS